MEGERRFMRRREMDVFDGHAAKRQRIDKDSLHPAYAGGNYHDYNQRAGGGRTFQEMPSNILLITVMNPVYPITRDVIHAFCSRSGKVMRIIIFRDNGVQAMVEFDSVAAAERAKESLNGRDIYSGCCTLKIEFAKSTGLNMQNNYNESWNYTNSGNRNEKVGPGSDGYDDYMLVGPRSDLCGPPARDSYGAIASSPHRYSRDPFARGDGYPMYLHGVSGYGPGGLTPLPGGAQQGAVVIVYGLNHEKMNADRLFNILCLYGNIVKVKFLKKKEGCAMVEMNDPLSVERAINNLNGSKLFSSKLQLGYSKHAFLNDAQQPYTLPDGTPCFKDYTSNRNNRFSNPKIASKNRILPPSKILHFFSAPFGIKEDEMKKVFDDRSAKPPATVKIFTSKDNSQKSSSGLLEFSSASDALEALALCNHAPISNPNSEFPYVLRLCFSSSGQREHRRGGY